MKNLQQTIKEFGVNRFASQITPDEADRLHKQFFGRNTKRETVRRTPKL